MSYPISQQNIHLTFETDLSGKRVISNDVDHFKRFYSSFFCSKNTPISWRADRVCVAVLFSTCVTLTARPISASSIRFCPPNISSVTIDHDELCELPAGRRVA